APPPRPEFERVLAGHVDLAVLERRPRSHGHDHVARLVAQTASRSRVHQDLGHAGRIRGRSGRRVVGNSPWTRTIVMISSCTGWYRLASGRPSTSCTGGTAGRPTVLRCA